MVPSRYWGLETHRHLSEFWRLEVCGSSGQLSFLPFLACGGSRHSLACGHITPVCLFHHLAASVCLCLSSLLRTFVIEFRAHLNPGQSHLQTLNLYLQRLFFPNKVVFADYERARLQRGGWAPFNLLRGVRRRQHESPELDPPMGG